MSAQKPFIFAGRWGGATTARAGSESARPRGRTAPKGCTCHVHTAPPRACCALPHQGDQRPTALRTREPADSVHGYRRKMPPSTEVPGGSLLRQPLSSDVNLRVRDAERGGDLLARRLAQLLAALLLSVGGLADAESRRDFDLRQPEIFAPRTQGRHPVDRCADNFMRNQIAIFSALRHVLLGGDRHDGLHSFRPADLLCDKRNPCLKKRYVQHVAEQACSPMQIGNAEGELETRRGYANIA